MSKNNSTAEKILRIGYYPISSDCVRVGEGAQIVNGEWYVPRFGCDTLQHIIDELCCEEEEKK